MVLMTGGEGGTGAGVLREIGIETDTGVETETGIGIEGREVREAAEPGAKRGR